MRPCQPARAATLFCHLVLAVAVSAADGDAPLWNVAWLTDTQTPAAAWIDALVASVRAAKPSMVLHTGDTRFEWANRCAWRSVAGMFHDEQPPHEFHLAPGNHDLLNGVLKKHLRRAATLGSYRTDTGRRAKGHYHNRLPEYVSGPLWPVWNPEVSTHPAWQITADEKPADWRQPVIPYRYSFTRGGVRFIVCDCFPTDDQVAWVRSLITRADASSVSILLQHKHEVDTLARYFEGIEGRHNVRLVLTGDHHNHLVEERHGVMFVTGAGMAKGPGGENDAMTLWVYRDRLRLDRHVIPAEAGGPYVTAPATIWELGGLHLDVWPAHSAVGGK